VKKCFSEEQIIGFLREAEAGLPVKELCRQHGFSEASYYLWRSKFGGMSVPDAKRLFGKASFRCRESNAIHGPVAVAGGGHTLCVARRPPGVTKSGTSNGRFSGRHSDGCTAANDGRTSPASRRRQPKALRDSQAVHSSFLFNTGLRIIPTRKLLRFHLTDDLAHGAGVAEDGVPQQRQRLFCQFASSLAVMMSPWADIMSISR